MDAPNTSPYITATPDYTNLPNSRPLTVSGGLAKADTGIGGTFNITTIGKLANINALNTPGFVTYNYAAQQFIPKSFQSDGTIAISNPDGQGSSTSFSVNDNTSLQKIRVYKNGVFGGERALINFIPGANTSITVGDDGLSKVDIFIETSTTVAPESASYITKTPEPALTNSQALSGLDTGIMKVTTGTGVVSIAAPDIDYQTASPNLVDIAALTPIAGDIIIGNGTNFSPLSTGPAGTFLMSNGAGIIESWEFNPPGYQVEVLSPSNFGPIPLVNNTTYITTNTSSTVIFSLPAGVAGQKYRVIGSKSTSNFVIEALVGQTIVFGSVSSAVGGSIASLTGTDAIEIFCVNANTFIATAPFGNLAVV